MRKDKATAIFDRLDNAGMRVTLKAGVDSGYEVVLGVDSLNRPDLLELVAGLVRRFDCELIPAVTEIRIVAAKYPVGSP